MLPHTALQTQHHRKKLWKTDTLDQEFVAVPSLIGDTCHAVSFGRTLAS